MSETVQQLLRARAEDDSRGMVFEGRTWSWREYVAAASARANALAELMTDDRVRHVGVLLENTDEMALALAAGAMGGHVTAGINLTRRGEGLRTDVLRADCQVLLTDDEHLPLLEGLDLSGVRVVNVDGREWPELVAGGAGPVRSPREVDTMDTFMLIFTSGTSGAPKAVRVSNLIVVFAGGMLVEKFGLTEDDACYLSMPLFHSNAVLSGYAVAIASGAATVLARRFSAKKFLPDVRRHGVTYMNYVGKPLAYLLETPPADDDADNPLKYAFGNEASERDIGAFVERFGCEVWDGFSSTETAVIITRGDDDPPGSIGTPYEEVAVYNRETRTECPRAVFDENGKLTNLDEAVGQLVNTTGGGYFGGYYNDEQATAERLDGGMFWSGDLAYRDANGYVFLAGRTSDWLRVGGENLAAGMVEQVLMRHPAISRVAVYAVPDPRVGDQLIAAVVLLDDPSAGPAPDPSSFEQFLAEQQDLSTKAWPRYLRIVSELPSTATNKVLKRELVKQGLEFDDPVWVREERGTAYSVQR